MDHLLAQSYASSSARATRFLLKGSALVTVRRRFDNEPVARRCTIMEHFARRRETLARSLPGEGLDAYLISNPVSVSYLTGFSGDSSYLLLGRDRALLVSDARFTVQLAEECPGLETYIRPPAQRPLNAVAATLDTLGHRD